MNRIEVAVVSLIVLALAVLALAVVTVKVLETSEDPCLANPDYRRTEDLGHGLRREYYCGWGLESSLWWYWWPAPELVPILAMMSIWMWIERRWIRGKKQEA